MEGALQFVNDLLSQEVLDLRSWGVKDVDYKVDEDGKYYKTQEMRTQAADTAYKASHFAVILISQGIPEQAVMESTQCRHSSSPKNSMMDCRMM